MTGLEGVVRGQAVIKACWDGPQTTNVCPRSLHVPAQSRLHFIKGRTCLRDYRRGVPVPQEVSQVAQVTFWAVQIFTTPRQLHVDKGAFRRLKKEFFLV